MALTKDPPDINHRKDITGSDRLGRNTMNGPTTPTGKRPEPNIPTTETGYRLAAGGMQATGERANCLTILAIEHEALRQHEAPSDD